MIFILILHEINELNSKFELTGQTRLSHLGLLRLMLTALRIRCGLLEPLRTTQIKQILSAEETGKVTSVMGDLVNAFYPQVTILLWLLSSTDKMPLKTF